MAAIYKSGAGRRLILERYEQFFKLWPVAFERLNLSTAQGNTHVIVSGKDDAPPLVLLHGSMSNAIMWLRDVGYYAKHYRVYALDIIGEAGFSAESRPDLHSDAYALWLDDVFAQLELSRPAMVGISLGGWLALDYAIRRPGQLGALAILCPAGVGRQKRDFFFKVLFYMMMGAWGKKRLRELITGQAAEPEQRKNEAYAKYVAYLSLLQKHFRPRIVSFKPFTDEQLGSLSMPVLVILGKTDVFFDSGETRDRLKQSVPLLKVVWHADRGHMLVDQEQHILQFLGECYSG